MKKKNLNQKNTKKYEPKYSNSSLSILVPKILKELENGGNSFLINKKTIVISKLLGLLRVSLKVLFQTNLQTLDNKFFIDGILKNNFSTLKDTYQRNTEKVQSLIGGKNAYLKKLNEINQELNVLNEKIEKNKTNQVFISTKSDSFKLLQTNLKLRNKSTKTIVKFGELLTEKKGENIKNDLQEIYESSIIPILNFLIEEDVISYQEGKTFEKQIKNLIKYGISRTPIGKQLMNSKITLEYGPLENINYSIKKINTGYYISKQNGKKDTYFGSKGTIGYSITEEIGNKKQTIVGGSEYMNLFQQGINYLKTTNKKKTLPKKILLFILIKQEYLNHHLGILNTLNGMIQTILDKVKEQGASEKNSEKIIQIGNSIILFKKKLTEQSKELSKNQHIITIK